MLAGFLFVMAIILTWGHLAYNKETEWHTRVDTFLGYILLLNMGVMGILAAYAHLFMGAETAKMIGWEAGSPFQFEIGMANLSYGVLGVLAFWRRGRFWEAACIGWCVFLLGCFVGHLIQYYAHHDTAPWNIGFFIWFNDLILPILVLCLLAFLETRKRQE